MQYAKCRSLFAWLVGPPALARSYGGEHSVVELVAELPFVHHQDELRRKFQVGVQVVDSAYGLLRVDDLRAQSSK